jgi:2Fe-2S ferredoxin
MAQIVIDNLGKKSIEAGDTSRSLLNHLQDNGIDWMQACGGKGRCTTCMVRALEGIENMEPQTPAEKKYFQLGALKENERLACQVRIKGDVLIAAPDEYKLPHVKYSY